MNITFDEASPDFNLLGYAEACIGDLISAWRRVDDSAPIAADYQKLDGITNLVTKGLGYFRDSNVLDIGCNSGLHSIVVSSVSNKVIGCDPNEVFIRRARNGLAELIMNGKMKGFVNFYCSDFVELLDRDINGIILARILYHIGDERLSLLMEGLQSKIEKVLIQCRPGRVSVYQNQDVAVTKKYNGLYRVEDCLSLLGDVGFREARVWGGDPLWSGGECFPVIYGAK